jgi:hypothetical protein
MVACKSIVCFPVVAVQRISTEGHQHYVARGLFHASSGNETNVTYLRSFSRENTTGHMPHLSKGVARGMRTSPLDAESSVWRQRDVEESC